MSPPGHQRGPESGESLEAPDALLGGAATPSYGPWPTNLVSLGGNAWDAFLSGYSAGYVAGIDKGREDADEEAADLHRQAHHVAMVMAGLEPANEARVARRRRMDEATVEMERRLNVLRQDRRWVEAS